MSNYEGLGKKISIHAPTRGATGIPDSTIYDWGFQSTLPREERPSVSCHVVVYTLFQSTLPREERLPFTATVCVATFISIHAPTRGATILQVRV